MAKKIVTSDLKPIPILFGEEGRKFIEQAEKPKCLTKREIERLKGIYKRMTEKQWV